MRIKFMLLKDIHRDKMSKERRKAFGIIISGNKMEEVKQNFFIDTNIFIDYIIGKETLAKTNQKNFLLFNHLKQSIDLLDFCFKHKEAIRFCTSFLNMSEMQSGLIEDIVRGKMYREGISFNFYSDCKNNFLKDAHFKKQVREVITSYYEFFKKEEIWFIQSLTCNENDLKDIDKLKMDFNLPSLDALIFFIAKKEKGYFVTTDRKQFLEPKKLKEEYEHDIKIVAPHEALKEMKKLVS